MQHALFMIVFEDSKLLPFCWIDHKSLCQAEQKETKVHLLLKGFAPKWTGINVIMKANPSFSKFSFEHTHMV